MIGDWARQRGYGLERTLCWEGRQVRPEDFDLLIVMGGPMGANDDHRFPFLQWEKMLLKLAVARGKFVLGICLGAQLIAEALGGTVGPSPEREVGVFPVRLSPDARRSSALSGLPDSFDALHWHGDMVVMPPRGAFAAASTPGCPVQAFSLGESCVGLQFHLESTPETLEALVTNCSDDLRSGAYIQDAETMREKVAAMQTRELLYGVLDRLVDE
jgi:GMP synthase-like glutamine amidotransferase